MKQTRGDILSIEKGIIIHQVNCQNVIGAGISGPIIKKYPKVKAAYHFIFEKMLKEKIFGKWQAIPVTNDLMVVNAFTQFEYGNPSRTKRVYTDIDKLVHVIKSICEKYPDKEVYIPDHIGCGYGGANWDDLLKLLEPLRVTIVKL